MNGFLKGIVKPKEPITPLAYPYYFLPVVLIVLIGFFDSVYLSVSHYRNYMDIGYQSFCAISQAFNCDTVSQSPYSILFGVPLAVWGILGYGFFLFLLGFAWSSAANKKRMWTLLMLIAMGFSIYSIVLAYISTYRIGSHCIMCILSYAVNFALLFYTWLIRNRFRCEPLFKALKLDLIYLLGFPKSASAIVFSFGGITIIVMMAFPAYWHLTPPDLSKDIPTGITEDGHPWIGAENPELTIVEFSDYRCFQCKKMHFYLRRLIEAHPDKIRLVHRNFPMDHTINPLVNEPFHPGAAQFAIISLFALEKDKFWEMNDILYDIPRQIREINLRYFAKKSGIEFDEIRHVFQNRRLWNKLIFDISDGLKYELTGTPGFVINDQVYSAYIPSEILIPYLK